MAASRVGRRSYVDGPYGQIHLRSDGEGGAPLLLLHQSPLSGAMFAAVLPLLARAGIHAVAMDTPGYGLSDRPLEPVGIAGYAESIPPVLDALGWPQANLLGHHTGVLIAAAFAAQHSTRVKGLILNGIGLLSDADRAHFAQFRFEPIKVNPDGSHLVAAWNRRLAASRGWTNATAMHRHVVETLANPDDFHWGFTAAFAHDVRPSLEEISVPTLILTNTGEDLYEGSRRAAALRTDFDFVALDGGTHDIVDEQPEAWVAAVTAWLNRSNTNAHPPQ